VSANPSDLVSYELVRALRKKIRLDSVTASSSDSNAHSSESESESDAANSSSSSSSDKTNDADEAAEGNPLGANVISGRSNGKASQSIASCDRANDTAGSSNSNASSSTASRNRVNRKVGGISRQSRWQAPTRSNNTFRT